MSTYGRMIDDRLSVPEGYEARTVLGGSVTVHEKIKQEPTKADIRKGSPVFSGVLKYFPNALVEVSKCSVAGQKQHNQGSKLYWDKNKSSDNEDALVRHLIDHGVSPIDDDGVLHLAKCAWRALAALEIYLDNESK